VNKRLLDTAMSRFLIMFVIVLCGVVGPTALSQAQELRVPMGVEPPTPELRAWVDVDGDGKDDLCYIGDYRSNHVECYLNKAEGLASKHVHGLWGAAVWSTPKWVDINGDAFIDVCRFSLDVQPTGMSCRLGPDFNGAPVFHALVIAGTPLICEGSGDSYGCSPGDFVPGVAPVQGGFEPDYHLADVTGDGVPDLCYVYNKDQTYYDMRCRIATVSNNRQTVTYSEESAAWTVPNMGRGAPNWPDGFSDFNGDGRADYCRLWVGAVLGCAVSGPNGFLPEFASNGAIPVGGHEGASFVDINADGNTDFCRVVSNALRCTLSNGVGWEYGGSIGATRELVSPSLDVGHANWRWWVDINGDGYPDYCRLVGADVVGNWTHDAHGTLTCRLGWGGDTTANPQIAFGYSDVVAANQNLGRADGGRTFCDPFGTGVPVLCRLTRSTFPTGTSICANIGYPRPPLCVQVAGEVNGYSAGYSNDLVQASPGLLTSYRDGVGAETRVTYLPLTNPEVYTRSNTTSNTDSRLLLMQPRSQVVFETRAWTVGDTTPITLTGTARYMYKDLRTDTHASSRGFRERWIFHEGANTLEHMVYYQGLGPLVEGANSGSTEHDLREIGMPKCQEKFAVLEGLIPEPTNINTALRGWRDARLVQIRSLVRTAPGNGPCSLPDQAANASNPFVLLQATANVLGLTEGAVNPRVKYVKEASVKSWDWDGVARVALPTSTTTTQMDAWGNVTRLVQSTVDGPNEWRKTTVNTYQDDRTKWLLGRLTRSEVTAVTPTAATQLAANATSAGSSPNASLMTPPPGTPVTPPISPAALAAILQLLMDD
jgi:FG-GAP-like repeat